MIAGFSQFNANLSRIEEVHEDKNKFISDSLLNIAEGDKNIPNFNMKKNSMMDLSKNSIKSPELDLEHFNKEQFKVDKEQYAFEQQIQQLNRQKYQKQQELSQIQKEGHYIEEQSILQQRDLTNNISMIQQKQQNYSVNYIDPKVQMVIQQMKNQNYNTHGQTVME